MRRGLLQAALASAVLSALGTGAHAAFGDFTYTTTVTPTTLPNTGAVAVTLTPLDGPNPLSAVNSGTDVPFGHITVDTTDLANGNTVILTNVAYTFSVTVLDLTSNTTDVVNITGTLSGTVSKNASGASSVNITNMYAPTTYSTKNFPPIYTFDLTGTQSFIAPGPGPALFGGFGAHVSAPAVPEPASAVLLGLGGAGFVLLLRRRPA